MPSTVGATDEANYYYDTQSLSSLSPGAPTFSRDFSTGRLVAVTYGVGSSSGDYYGYDAAGRGILKIQQTGGINYQMSAGYNKSGAMVTESYPSGNIVNYGYDVAGRTVSFTGNLGGGTTNTTYSNEVTYSPLGGLTKEKFGTTTPIYNKLFYNSRGQLAEIRESTSYTDATDTTWNRGAIINHYSGNCWGMCGGSNSSTAMTDDNGNLKKQEVYIPNDDQVSGYTMRWQEFDYDALNRLSWAREVSNGAEQWKQEFTYDRYGNRTINTGSTYGVGINNTLFEKQDSTNRLYAPGDLALPDSSRRMRYDNAGNLSTDTYTGAGNRTYDAENRITSAMGGIQTSQAQLYSYDASGQRIKRTVDGVETWAVYGFSGEMVAEYAANGSANSPQKEYGYRNGQLLVTAEPEVAATNVALAANGATVTGSSSFSGYAASGAINGDRKGLFGGQDGYWSSAASGFPAWVEVNFNASQTISEIDVFTVQDNYNAPIEPTETMTFSAYGLSGYDVQYWNGSSWIAITGGNVTSNNKVWRKFTFAAVTTTKIRVLSNASPDNWSRLTEVEAWTAPSPAPRYDLALGATATASSSYSSGYGPSGAINGDRKSLNWSNGGGWNDAAPGNSFPDWLQIDFGSTKTLGEIDVFTLQDNYAGSVEPTESTTFSLYGLTGYEVQYWDGANWVTVSGGSVTGNNKVWRKFTFAPVSTSKIRVLTNAAVDGYSRIIEVEAYAPESVGSNSNLHWLVTDQLGTPRMVFDQTGGLTGTSRHDYLPFGEELFVGTGGRTTAQGYTGDGIRQKFTLKERDIETGLDYFGARYYTSMQGRFTGVDPQNYQAMLDPTDPQSWNGYAYVNNNPLKRVDPDGKGFWDRLKNAFFYGYFVENDQIAKMEQERREWLSHNYYERDSQGNWRPFDASNLSRQDVFDKYREVQAQYENGQLHPLTVDEAIQAWSTVSPALNGDPYNPKTVDGRQAEWDALRKQMQAESTLSKPVLRKLGGLASRAEETVADVIRSRGGSASNVKQVGEWAQKTLAEAAKAAVSGDKSAETAIKVAKGAGGLGQKY